jgi:hypothetical protein
MPNATFKHRIGNALAALTVLGAIMLAGCAGGSYSAASLRGEYHYNLVQLRIDETAPNVDYCDEFGTITFDGTGGAEGVGERKCSVTGHATESGRFTYTVSPNGAVLMTEAGATEATHGQIVKRGKMVLIDGTTRTSGILVMHGVAAKK